MDDVMETFQGLGAIATACVIVWHKHNVLLYTEDATDYSLEARSAPTIN